MATRSWLLHESAPTANRKRAEALQSAEGREDSERCSLRRVRPTGTVPGQYFTSNHLPAVSAHAFSPGSRMQVEKETALARNQHPTSTSLWGLYSNQGKQAKQTEAVRTPSQRRTGRPRAHVAPGLQGSLMEAELSLGVAFRVWSGYGQQGPLCVLPVRAARGLSGPSLLLLGHLCPLRPVVTAATRRWTQDRALRPDPVLTGCSGCLSTEVDQALIHRGVLSPVKAVSCPFRYWAVRRGKGRYRLNPFFESAAQPLSARLV